LPDFQNIPCGTTVDERPVFPGTKAMWTEKLEFTEVDLPQGIPVYHVMDKKGTVLDPSQDPNLSPATLIKMYRSMTLLNTMDRVMYEAQRCVNEVHESTMKTHLDLKFQLIIFPVLSSSLC
jgi:hypothetical protein